jgi:F420-non-reducing hydrogenase large subunit
MAGRAIHSPAAVPGGFSKPVKSEERGQLLEMAKECLDSAAFSIKFAKENIFPKYIDAVKTLGVINTGFLGIVAGDGSLNFYDGQLRMMQANGATVDFAPASYLDYIIEHTEPWTYPKFPYDKRAGKIVLDPDNPVGVYRVGPLARINVCEKMTTPLAQKEFEEFRKTFGRPAQPSLLYHWARLIELLYAAERTVQLLEDPEIISPDVRKAVKPRAARGVGVVEAPRGTLIHDYETDENDMVKDINLIVATQHNNAAMNLVVKQTASRLIKGGKYDQGILNKIEMTVRPYDPCLSCATHTIYGGIAMQMDILDSDGRLVASLTN